MPTNPTWAAHSARSGPDHHGDHSRRIAGVAIAAVFIEQGASRCELVGADQAARVARAANERHLRDHALDATVLRRDGEHVPTAVAGAEDADAGRVGFRQGFDKADGVAPVLDLHQWIEFLPWLAVTRAEAAMVVDQSGNAALREQLGVLVEVDFLD